ncbi:MAG: hypothetical protein JNK82_02130 [Myxococcaceae bacterium]|nr:hypothetical protein [Myxococcaceae bacterium]
MRSRPHLAVAVLCAALLGACVKNPHVVYASVSSGPTGCEPDDIVISSDANPFLWKATCGGVEYTCISTKGMPAGAPICTRDG